MLLMEAVAAHITDGAVVLRDGVDALHGWPQGWYGELTYEAPWSPRLEGCQTGGTSGGEAGTSSEARPRLLQLSFAEAFYLAFVLPDEPLEQRSARLVLVMAGDASLRPIGAAECWQRFRAARPRFAHELAAYRALRRAGWIVRSGLKYGAALALYASDGQRPSHAAFCALVHAPQLGDAAPSWLAVQQHSRVCGQVAKGLLLCTVEGGEDALDEPGGLERLGVSTLSLSPWSAAREHAQLSK